MRDWRGPIAFVLAAGVAITLVSGMLAAELTGGKITSEEISLLSTLGGAAIGAVAAYLGIRQADRSADPQEPQESDTEQFDALDRED